LDAPLGAARQRLMLLRELDETIDFAKSVIQLDAVLALYHAEGGLTLDALCERIGERRKAVLDALRKLEMKGLVAREARGGDVVLKLSEKGLDYARKLVEFLSPAPDTMKRQPDFDAKLRRSFLIDGLVEAHYLYRAIVALGSSESRVLSLEELAKAMGLSPERAKSYLDVFCLPPKRVFRRIQKPGRGTFYKLEDEGLKIYYKLPDYRRREGQGVSRGLAKRVALQVLTCLPPCLAVFALTSSPLASLAPLASPLLLLLLEVSTKRK